jgi:maltodextrin utilization protein YvdJ
MMLETVAWIVVLMGLGAFIVLAIGAAIIWISKEDI